ncbi:MAG: hypothetical protein ACYDBV_11875 [Nitrospiria bacterium]
MIIDEALEAHHVVKLLISELQEYEPGSGTLAAGNNWPPLKPLLCRSSLTPFTTKQRKKGVANTYS